MFPSKTASERRADFVIHMVSLVGFPVAAFFLLREAGEGGVALIAALIVYALAGLSSVGVSFAYHLLPWHDHRATLRRWDHAAIYVVIAGTFSPLLVKAGTQSAHILLTLIWLLAAAGVWFKLSGDNGDSRWSLASYLGLGAFCFIALPDFWAELPPGTTYALGGGAVFYTIGTAFYRRKNMPFRYPIWHFWGTLGASCFLASIWIAVASSAHLGAI